ncbi:MAG: SRPBCC family protein [Burkholderiales bacterium]|nr:SRPBCC family protein [Burkholderiales bacterium]
MKQSMLKAVALTAMAMAVPAVQAADWNTIHTIESVNIAASPEEAWAAVSRWNALESWCPVFVKTEITGGGAGVGSVRAITIKDGPTFTEELLLLDSDTMTYRYKIIESPLPFVDYTSTVKVRSIGGGNSQILWVGSYKRRDGDSTSPAAGDMAAEQLLTGVYKTCLSNAKKMLQAQ